MYKYYNGQAWITERVEQVGADSNGSKNWIALDREDVPHIAYDGWVSPPSNYNSALKIKARTPLGWTTEMQKMGNSIDISFVIDAANHSYVSYNTETSVSDYALYYGRQLDPSTPTPTATLTLTPTTSESPSPTPTIMLMPTWTVTSTPTEVPTITLTITPTETMIWNVSPTIMPTETPTASATPTAGPTDEPTPSFTPISLTSRLYLPLMIR
jgi:hypothetical protein